MDHNRTRNAEIVLRHIVPSFFCGYLLLAAFSLNCGEDLQIIHTSGKLHMILLAAAFCGIGTAFINAFYHEVLHARIMGRLLGTRSRQDRLRHVGISAITGLVCGGATIFLALSDWGLGLSTLVLLLLTITHLKKFGRNVITMLKPGHYCVWPEILRLVEIYINIIVCFTLFNATLEVAHRAGLLSAIQFPFAQKSGVLVDALYFTVITMTTLGFGDITPLSAGAKLLTTLECMTGYVMFALTVGIITRGVVSVDDENM